MAEPRRYQLQNDVANRLIADLLDAEEVPAERRGYIQQLLTTVLKLHEDGAGITDLGYRCWRGKPSVTVVPRPGSLWMEAVPPCKSMIDFTRARPRPTPSELREESTR